MSLYAWPPQTAHGRVIPKSRIYGGAGATKALQAKFVAQVDRIEWTHVLRPDTLNLKAADGVEELAVIALSLRSGQVDPAVLAAIDKAIPRPVLFELAHGGKRAMAAAWKRPSLAEAGKWVTSSPFIGPWQAVDAPRVPLPQALDIAALYIALLDPLLPPRRSPTEPVAERILRVEEADRVAREIARIEAGLAREKQFNRKVELNRNLNAARQSLSKLLGT